jgi:hypothetical protein
MCLGIQHIIAVYVLTCLISPCHLRAEKKIFVFILAKIIFEFMRKLAKIYENYFWLFLSLLQKRQNFQATCETKGKFFEKMFDLMRFWQICTKIFVLAQMIGEKTIYVSSKFFCKNCEKQERFSCIFLADTFSRFLYINIVMRTF